MDTKDQVLSFTQRCISLFKLVSKLKREVDEINPIRVKKQIMWCQKYKSWSTKSGIKGYRTKGQKLAIFHRT